MATTFVCQDLHPDGHWLDWFESADYDEILWRCCLYANTGNDVTPRAVLNGATPLWTIRMVKREDGTETVVPFQLQDSSKLEKEKYWKKTK